MAKLRNTVYESHKLKLNETELKLKELEEMEARLAEESAKILIIEEEWKNFSWDDMPWDGEYAGELIGFLNNPALLAGIRDPKKIAAAPLSNRARGARE